MTVNLSTVEYKSKAKNNNYSYTSGFGGPNDVSNGFSIGGGGMTF